MSPELEAPFIDGLLTGFVTTPQGNLKQVFSILSPLHPLPKLARKNLLIAAEQIRESLSDNTFEADFHHGDVQQAKHWLEGYFKAIEHNEKAWEQANADYPKAAAALAILHSLVDQGMRQALNIQESAEEELRDDPQLISRLVNTIYQIFHHSHDTSFNLLANEEVYFDPEELANMDIDALFHLVTTLNDHLPLEVVTECANRGDAMVTRLHQHLLNEENWSDNVSEGDWWAILHAIFILGKMPGKKAANALLEGFKRVTYDYDIDLCDWFSGYWPALFANKTEHVLDALRDVAEDRTLAWYPRNHAVECVLAAAVNSKPKGKLEDALDWLADQCADEEEDPAFRVTAGQYLLNFPRERHRQILEDLLGIMELEPWLRNSFSQEDIDQALLNGDTPPWLLYTNPWTFYSPDEIARRQQRWNEEDQERDEPYNFTPDMGESDDFSPSQVTYIRDHPKTGRNDPCPCGSGKKYKKCCLEKQH